MVQKSFVTSLPDKSGSFLKASKIVADNNGNIIRVSYNKAVDLHMLFIDVEATDENIFKIEEDLLNVGYINKEIPEKKVIEISVKIPDHPGAVLPVLEVLNEHDINISYMNSVAGGNSYQDFKFGLLIENPKIIKTLLETISKIYPIDVVECDSSEENLDNTVFYIKLANEIQSMFGLSTEKTMQFISESNRILQVLQSKGENASKVFDYIRRVAYFVNSCRGENYKTNIQKVMLSDKVTLYSIQPYCGSNTYLLVSLDELVMIDTGYAIFADEIEKVIKSLIPDFDKRIKKIYITHADVDHCGLLYKLDNAQIFVNQKSAENFDKQLKGLPDFREQTELHLGYNKISRIISGYTTPDINKLQIIDKNTPKNHDSFIKIADLYIDDLDFEIYEGSGGHVYGEMIYVCKNAGVVFTGDILVNISGFSKERAEFNSLAPYLMKSVNVNSTKATVMRNQVVDIINKISVDNKKPCIICGGHGPVSILQDIKMINLSD
ncbi:MAG: MBL fold hydrolase [Clostridiales bacterium GWF2_36_10]|nr:MAG: MBL fold hydrolase [Clostridiales bacterium GWF2_36_10]HAN20110.1 MBL fold hydrolase [Clostridiales bacterium]